MYITWTTKASILSTFTHVRVYASFRVEEICLCESHLRVLLKTTKASSASLSYELSMCFIDWDLNPSLRSSSQNQDDICEANGR